MEYGAALEMQRDLVARRIAGEIPDTLLFVVHPHVFTLGKVARREHLLPEAEEVEVVETDRGGDVTYHGPGQMVVYPVIDLTNLRQDVKWYLERLEEVLILTVERWGIRATRVEGMTGAWVEGNKIGAIGVRVQRWVTSHGFALNVSTDLSYFDRIIIGFQAKPYPEIWWNAWMRRFQIMDQLNLQTEDIPVRFRRLRQISPGVGGERFKREMKRLANKQAPKMGPGGNRP